MGAGCIMDMNDLKVGFTAMLFSSHIDSIAAGGLFMDDIWNGRRIFTIDLLGDEFLEVVKTGDPISIHEDGTVEVGREGTTIDISFESGLLALSRSAQ